MIPLVGVLVLALASQEAMGQIDVFYRCKVYGEPLNSWEMKLFVRPTGQVPVIIQKVNSIDAVSGVPDNVACSNFPPTPAPFQGLNPIQEVVSELNMLTLTVAINPATDTGEPVCQYAKAGANGLIAGQFEWRFNIETEDVHPDFKLYFEKVYNLSCDFNNISMTQTEFYYDGVEVRPGAVPVITPLSDNVKLTLVDVNQNPLGVVQINTLVGLKAELITEGAVPGPEPYTGVSPHDCFACDNQFCDGNTLRLTDFYGCPVNLISAGFTGTGGVILYTGTFQVLSFNQGSGAIITCIFDFCTASTGLLTCENRCANLAPGRKKRDANPRVADFENDKRLSIPMKVIQENMNPTRDPVVGVIPKRETPAPLVQEERIKCYASTGFIVAVSLLSVVLFLCILMSACLCLRLSRIRRQKESLYTSSTNVSVSTGKRNLAYN